VRGKQTARQILTKHWKATGKKPRQLTDHGECPEGFDSLMDTFYRLCRQRPRAMGMDPISHTEIDAFQRLEGLSLRPWQVQAIEQIDAFWRAVQP